MGKMPQLGVYERWLQTHHRNEDAASTSTWAMCDTKSPFIRLTRIIKPNGRATRCGESGAWAPISATPDGAIELAEMALGIHHSLVHGNPFESSNQP